MRAFIGLLYRPRLEPEIACIFGGRNVRSARSYIRISVQLNQATC
jgi:hypothetical protein